jgi:hypothetical protein
LRYCSHLTPSQLALASKASVASGVVSACDSAKYVSAMKEFATATAVQTTAQSGLVARLPSVAADASSFSQLFSDYMEAGKAVELKPMQTDTTQPDLDPDSVEASVKDAITACANVVASQADLVRFSFVITKLPLLRHLVPLCIAVGWTTTHPSSHLPTYPL